MSAEYAACPLCKQYSHSIREDMLGEAIRHFQMMFSHRGDGIPTQFCFDEQTRDHAQVLVAAASGILTEGGDAKQAPGDSLSSPTRSEAEGDAHD
jgi:hypothetical protein